MTIALFYWLLLLWNYLTNNWRNTAFLGDWASSDYSPAHTVSSTHPSPKSPVLPYFFGQFCFTIFNRYTTPIFNPKIVILTGNVLSPYIHFSCVRIETSYIPYALIQHSPHFIASLVHSKKWFKVINIPKLVSYTVVFLRNLLLNVVTLFFVHFMALFYIFISTFRYRHFEKSFWQS